MISVLDGIEVPFALIGGLALALHNVIRATQDVDILVGAENAEKIDKVLTALGYDCLYRSTEAEITYAAVNALICCMRVDRLRATY